MRLSEIFCDAQGNLLRDGEFDIFGILTTHAQGKKVFSYINDKRFQEELANGDLSCIVCTKELLENLPGHIKGVIISENPGETFWQIHSRQKVIKFPTLIGNNCKISEKAYIAKENVIIGDNAIIEEFVSVKECTKIGDNCVIRAGSVVGGEGFQLQIGSGQAYSVVKHLGNVLIGDNVELQQSVCVDKALFSWDSTVIGDGTKVDNLAHIGHAVKIGRNCRITAGVIFAGSVVTQDNVWFGINASIRNNITIEKNANISMGSVVTKRVEKDKKVSGNFAIDHNAFIENIKHSVT